eukprot:Rmarinus@m.1660
MYVPTYYINYLLHLFASSRTLLLEPCDILLFDIFRHAHMYSLHDVHFCAHLAFGTCNISNISNICKICDISAMVLGSCETLTLSISYIISTSLLPTGVAPKMHHSPHTLNVPFSTSN